MVFVNDKKFACESCIKGHRSSSCSHNDRPLFEIKKKGRPVSQCPKCRELRQNNRVHTKCLCPPPAEAPPKPELKAINKKYVRYMPTVPTLPNGLKDALKSNDDSAGIAHPRQRVTALLNPCPCRDLWSCTCPAASSSNASASNAGCCGSNGSGLHALAEAASMQNANVSVLPQKAPPRRKQPRPRSQSPIDLARSQAKRSKTQPVASCCAPDPTESTPAVSSCCAPAPDSPRSSPAVSSCCTPAVAFPRSSAPAHPLAPVFPVAPPPPGPVHTDSECTCGHQCQCPGCVEHRGQDHASSDVEDCISGKCHHCVDHASGIGIELPDASGASSSFTFGGAPTAAASTPFSLSMPTAPTSTNIIDQFFARAAALPLPPPPRFPPSSSKNGPVGFGLDPTNVVVYKPEVFTDPTAAMAVGLVVGLPKLCCRGNCGCAEGTCGCGETCDGCCEFHSGEEKLDPGPSSSSSARPAAPPAVHTETTPIASCCAPVS